MEPRTEIPPGWQRRRRGSLIFPIVLIVAGLILLLNNLGVVPWSIWPSLARLWPVLLILLGVDLVIGRRFSWFGAAIAVIMLALVVGVALIGARVAAPSSGGPTTVRTEAVPLNGATGGDLTVNFGAGELNVGALPAGSPNLVQLSGIGPGGAFLTPQTRLQNGTATVSIDTRGNPQGWALLGPAAGNGSETSMLLNPRVPETLRLNLGAGDATLDLTNVPVRDLSVNNGAGQLEVRFPDAAGTTTADIHSGAGQVTLVIPRGVGAAIHATDGLVNLHVSYRFQATSDGYRTDDATTAANRLDITLHVGFGSVDVE
jgi:hypothetical protein